MTESKLASWRKGVERSQHACEIIERFARSRDMDIFKHAELRWTWWPIALDVCSWGSDHSDAKGGGSSLPWFTEMVRLMSERIGYAPHTIKGAHTMSETGSPDLSADWPPFQLTDTDVPSLSLCDKGYGQAIEGQIPVSVRVRVLHPVGCRIDPRTDVLGFDERKGAELHPECVSVLSDLQDTLEDQYTA